jgi:parvulin-like peptidyl-prolyl isomerase
MTLGRHSRGPLLALAGLLVALVVIVGVTSGFGGPSLPDGAAANVEEVSNGEITREEFEGGLETAAARQGVRQVPEEGTPQYDLVADEAMADLLLGRWVRGEAEERGIEVTDTEVDRELQQIIDQQFGSRQQFDRFLEQNAFTEEEALERVELQLLSQGIQEEAVPEGIEVSDEEIETYYDENIEQFQTPETRDVRTILTPDEAEAEEALSELEADDSPRSWEAVAEEFSTDEATANAGGLRQGVVEGQNEPELDEAIFAATEGELVGPLETDRGFYVFQVQSVEPESTQPLDEETRGQIEQTLVSQRQQELAQAFQADFVSKWSSRTVCADDVVMERCGNAPPPGDECVGDDEGEEVPADPQTGEVPELACPAFVPSTQPVPPSSAGDPGASGLPQGPQTGATAQDALEGAFPVGPAGAPPVPGG